MAEMYRRSSLVPLVTTSLRRHSVTVTTINTPQGAPRGTRQARTRTDASPHLRVARRLAPAQALYIFGSSVDLTLTGIVGVRLAPVPALATLPFSLIPIAAVASTFVVSRFIGRVGYRATFTGVAAVAAVAGLVSALAVQLDQFWLFCIGTGLIGVYSAGAGYYRYAAMMFLQRWSLLPLSARRAIAETAAPLRENPARRGWARVIREIVRAGAEDSDAARYLRFVEMSSAAQRSKLYNASMKSAVAGAAPERYLSDALTAATQDAGRTIDRYLATDLHTYLPECLMVKTDIASMAHSLEVRCPFLDHEFVEYAARLPDDWKWHPLLQTKWILRRALRERLPEGVRRQKKKGFEIPVAEWLRGPLKGFMESALFSPSSISREWFDQMALRRLVDAHASGRENHFHLLWGLLMLELWRRSSRSLSA